MRCKKLSKKIEKKIIRKTTYASKGPHVTLRKYSRAQACIGKPRVICRRGTLTQSHQRVAIGRTITYKDKQYMKIIIEFSSMMLSRSKASFHCQRVHQWPILILHSWKGSIQRHHRKSRDQEGRSLRDACLGKPRSLRSQWLMKSQLMEQVPARKIKTDMEWSSLRMLKGFRNQTTNWILFCQDGHGVMNVVFRQIFGVRTHVVATTVCTTVECTNTHLLHAHFSAQSACTITFAHFSCVPHTRTAQVSVKRFVACACLWSLSPSPFSCLTHPCCSRTVTSRPLPTTTSLTIPSTRSCRTYLSWKRRTRATPHEHRGVWLRGQIRSQHRLWAPNSSTRILPWMMTRRSSTVISPTSRKPRKKTPAKSVFTKCLNPLRFSWWFCSSNRKQRKHAIGKPLLDREKEKKEQVLWSVLQSRCQRKVNGTVFVWVWRVRENSLLKSLRKFYSDGWDLREHLQRRAQHAILAENSDQRKLCLNEYEMEIQNSERRNSEYTLIESQRELESQRRQLLEANQSKLNVREYIWKADRRWRTIFKKNAKPFLLKRCCIKMNGQVVWES